MIVLINILEHGLKQTKVVSKYERERIKTIEQQMAQIKESRSKQLDGLWRARNGINKDQDIE